MHADVLSGNDEDISPRTLRQASERLAQYTVEEGGTTGGFEGASEQWADVFSERGNMEPGTSDPDCVLISYSWRLPLQSEPSGESSSAQVRHSAYVMCCAA